jgi:cytochrome b561
MLRNGASRYGTVARSLDWLVAALVVLAFLVGERTADLEGAARLQPRSTHALSTDVALGRCVLAVGLLRLAGRWHDRPPPLP